MNRKPAIISIKNYKLSTKEKKLIKKEKPWGIILFSRNIKSFDQLKKLTSEIRKCINDPKYPIMIDEEGGTVSRLSHLINTREFSQSFFGKLFEKNNKNGKIIYEYYLSSICSVLKSIGININTIPVLDLLSKSTHEIIKNRCYSNKVKIVKSLGHICVENLRANKIGSVAKHIPGHGRGNSDSHKAMPIVNENIKKLYLNDFATFRGIKCNFVMTAHILFKKIDPYFVATQSNKIINKIIRKKIGFKGLIISDDISMKALKGDILSNAKNSLKSGCNLILYCGGKYNESATILKGLRKIDNFTINKTQQFYEFLR